MSENLVTRALDAMGVALAERGHTWSRKLRRLYESAIAAAQAEEEPLMLETAPKDGTIIRLHVDYSGLDGDRHALANADRAWTIGFNNFDDDGEDRWQFAGYCWTREEFAEGKGKVIGWLPFETATAPLDATRDAVLRAMFAAYTRGKDWGGPKPDDTDSDWWWCAQDAAEQIAALSSQAAAKPPLSESEIVASCAQFALDQQSDDPQPGTWNDACLHIAAALSERATPVVTGSDCAFDRRVAEIIERDAKALPTVTLPDGTIAEVRHVPDASERKWPNSPYEYEVWVCEAGDDEPYVSANAASVPDALRNIADALWPAHEPAIRTQLNPLSKDKGNG